MARDTPKAVRWAPAPTQPPHHTRNHDSSRPARGTAPQIETLGSRSSYAPPRITHPDPRPAVTERGNVRGSTMSLRTNPRLDGMKRGNIRGSIVITHINPRHHNGTKVRTPTTPPHTNPQNTATRWTSRGATAHMTSQSRAAPPIGPFAKLPPSHSPARRSSRSQPCQRTESQTHRDQTGPTCAV